MARKIGRCVFRRRRYLNSRANFRVHLGRTYSPRPCRAETMEAIRRWDDEKPIEDVLQALFEMTDIAEKMELIDEELTPATEKWSTAFAALGITKFGELRMPGKEVYTPYPSLSLPKLRI